VSLYIRFMRRILRPTSAIFSVVFIALTLIHFVSRFVDLLLRLVPKDSLAAKKVFLRSIVSASSWDRRELRRFLNSYAELSQLPTIEEGMNTIGMQSLFEQYWLRESLLRQAKGWMDPLQRPAIFIPGLRPQEFFAESLFPWLPALEAALPAIKAEYERSRFTLNPYKNEAGLDHDLFADKSSLGAERYGDRSWMVAYLFRGGVATAEKEFPTTLAALNAIPTIDRTLAMFSRLGANTWIPPHHGLCNAMIRVHVPISVPDHCQIRVGKSYSDWKKTIFFDDSYEHEVWNRSDTDRVVLFFNVFHPALSTNEIKVLNEFFTKELTRVPAFQYWDAAQRTM
jgi:aspartyl/asparaginyl beta-hydroxylase (cupin superfamily)